MAIEIAETCSQLESRFEEAGRILGGTQNVLAHFIQSLTQLSAALDGEVTSATIRDLLVTADELRALPGRHSHRSGQLLNLSKTNSALRRPVQEMQRQLKQLRVFAFNIKITSSGIGIDGGDFVAFADSMQDQIDLGAGELANFVAHLDDIDCQMGAALAAEGSIGHQSNTLVPALPERLTQDARSIEMHHRSVARIAVSTAEVAQGIQNKIAAAVAALQIGDTTRQRLEHVQTALGLAKARAESLPAGSDAPNRLMQCVLHMLADQMSDIADEFSREVSRLSENLSGLAADSSEILDLREAALSTGEAQGQLNNLADSISQALTLLKNLQSATDMSDTVFRSTRSAVKNLNRRIVAIRSVREDIHMMSINTHLRCNRLGEVGMPLSVIALELTSHARQLEASAKTATERLWELEQLDRNGETARMPAVQFDGTALGESVQRLKHANSVVEGDLMDLSANSKTLTAYLADAKLWAIRGRELADMLNGRASGLRELVDFSITATEDIVGAFQQVMDEVAEIYTMARERDLHARYAQLPENARSPVPSDDLMDVLF